MEVFTKEQRVEILENSKIDIAKGECMCHAIKEQLRNRASHWSDYFNSDVMRLFPEILKHKPDGVREEVAWFDYDKDGTSKRLQIIDELIKFELNK